MTEYHGELPSELMPAELDRGTQAAERVRAAGLAYKAKRFVRKVLISLFMIALLTVAAVAYYGYSTKITGRLTDTRPCSWTVGDTVVLGTRSYSYPYIEVFGLRNIDTSQIEEKTVLNVTGNGITIIGLDGDQWWSNTVKEGERGVQVLKHSDSYIFQIGKGIGVAKYAEFCK